jgi:O-antigen/teichoic acid export membrane protein
VTTSDEKTNPEDRGPSQKHRVSYSHGVLLTGIGSGVSVVFLFLETMVAVRFIDPTSYGIYALLIAVVGFLVVLADVGCKSAVTRLIASKDRDQQAALANSIVIFRLLMVTVVSLVIWLGRDLLLLFDSTGDLLRYASYIPMMLAVTSLDELFFGMLRGFHAHRSIAVAAIIRSVLRLGITVVFLVVFDLGVLSLIYSWTIAFGLSSLYGYLVLPIPKRLIYQPSLIVEILRFGFPLHLTRFLGLMSGRIHVLLLGALAGPTSVAFYSVASRLPSGAQSVSESYITVYFPAITQLVVNKRQAQASNLLNHSVRLASFAMASAAIFSVVFSREIITFVFTDQYLEASLAFGLKMIGLQGFLVVSMMGYSLTAAGYPKRSLSENIARSVWAILGDLVLIPILSFVGPALSSLSANYFTSPLLVWLLSRSGYTVKVAAYVKQTILLLFCSGLFWLTLSVDAMLAANLLFKTAIIILFVVLNMVFATVSFSDLGLVLPAKLTHLLGIKREPLFDGQ